MYERSAIVLERYLQTILGYRKRSNLKNNYKNYCKLIEDVEKYQETCIKEKDAVKEFNSTSEEISDIQKREEKLYKKSAKLEYTRNIIFNNIEVDPEETEKCVIKIEASVEKNSNELIELRKEFIEKVKEYSIKKKYMQECKENKKNAEAEYKETLRATIENKQKIEQENVDFVREFIESDNKQYKKELIQIMEENGEGEKNPFDPDIIENAANLGIDIAKKEAECYLFIYDKTEKLLSDIEKRLIEINRFKRWARDITVKLNFLSAEKEYLVQFLDYERITVIHPKKTHRKLMLEACRNLADDVVQINNLFELILKEIAGRSTKKGYKQLYNKSYLLEIEQTEVDFQKEKDRININAGTIINSNYWRIEGIKNIYTVFYNNVSEVYGKDLDEFDLPRNEEAEEVEENINLIKDVEEQTETKPAVDPIDLIFETSEKTNKEEVVEEEDGFTFVDSTDEQEEDSWDDEEELIETDETDEEDDFEIELEDEVEDILSEDEEEVVPEEEQEKEKVSMFEEDDGYDNYITDFNDEQEESLWDSIGSETNSVKKSEESFEAPKEKKKGLFNKLSRLNKKSKKELIS